MADAYQFARRLPLQQQAMFVQEFDRKRKSPALAILLCLFLGGFGAHHFYLRRPILGVIYLVFFWTFVPAILAFFETIFVPSAVESLNEEIGRGMLMDIDNLNRYRGEHRSTVSGW